MVGSNGRSGTFTSRSCDVAASARLFQGRFPQTLVVAPQILTVPNDRGCSGPAHLADHSVSIAGKPLALAECGLQHANAHCDAALREPPGFHYGVDGKPSPLERVRQGYGRISIGHSELNGARHIFTRLQLFDSAITNFSERQF
jgi:hypothetical protein